jgi:hypothetical protein
MLGRKIPYIGGTKSRPERWAGRHHLQVAAAPMLDPAVCRLLHYFTSTLGAPVNVLLFTSAASA